MAKPKPPPTKRARARLPGLGASIRKMRKAKGLTLDEAAVASGISRSLFAQMETTSTNPTIATLWSVAQALEVDVAELLRQAAEDPRREGLFVRVDPHATPTIKSEDGRCELKILSPPESTGKLEWYALSAAPGGFMDSPPHATGAIEHLTVLSGKFEVSSGQASESVSTGETLRYSADLPHAIQNAGRSIAKAFIVVMLQGED